MDKSVFFRNALLALFLAPVMTAHADDLDIVGITRGMSVEAAEAAISDYNSELKLGRTQYYMNYSDGVKTLRTEDYVRMITTAPHRADQFIVTFAAPPDKPEVLAFERIHRFKNEPVDRAVYYQALVDKYGAPSREIEDTRANALYILWYVGADKVNCLPGRLQPGERPRLDVTLQNSMVKEIQDSDGKMKMPEAKTIEDCAVMLQYRLEGNPVTKATGAVVDVVAAAKNELNVATWMEELSSKAREELAKSSKSAKPKL